MARRAASTPPPTVSALLDSEANVARLTAHAGRLLQLQRQLELALPRQLAASVRVANYRLGKVVIHATNGAIAVKVRQVVPGLAEKYRQNGTEVNEIEVKVQPIQPVIKAKPEPRQTSLGESAKQGLTSLVEKLPPEAPLRAALERLLSKK